MKLKKIASLMLAGIMAVSMLAGCSTANNNSDENPEDEIVATSDYADTLHDSMNGSARKKVAPAANSDLDAALEKAVANYMAGASFNLKSEVNVVDGKFVDSIVSDLDAVGKIGKLNSNDKGKDAVGVNVYAFSYRVSDTYALELVAGQIDSAVADLVEESDDHEFAYTYTISASIESKTETFAGVTNGVKFVAVAVNRTAAKTV